MTTLWAKHQYAKCFGHWVVKDPECQKCAVSDECEKRTKSRSEDDKAPEASEETGEAEQTLTPLEYLLQSLSGKYKQEFEEKANGVKVYKFSKDGQLMEMLGISSSGKKMMIAVRGQRKEFDIPGTIEEAEAILAEMTA